MPKVEIVDLRQEAKSQRQEKEEGPKKIPPEPYARSLFSSSLKEALQENLRRGKQSLIFLNRRGFANFLQCRLCGFVLRCPNCSVTMTFHLKQKRVYCHHCGFGQPAGEICSDCGNPTLTGIGFGTEQVEQELHRFLPGARIARMDRDTTGKRGSQERIIRLWEKGEIDALVGYGHHGLRDPIQDFYCQACHHKFSARRHTTLYHLKTPPARVAQVLHAVAEGLSAQAAARVFQLSETTVRSWINRAGRHSRCLHNRLMRALPLTHVQLDELRLKLRGATEAAWLWVACDARTKIIPAFALGPRTQAKAHQLVHEVAQRLAPNCLPIFSSDGLALYFYALTAQFGEWGQTLGVRHRVWMVSVRLLYAQVTPHLRRVQVSNGTVAAA